MNDFVTMEMNVNDLSALRAALSRDIYHKRESQWEYKKRDTEVGRMLVRACQREIDVAEALLERVIKKEDEFYSMAATRECPCMDPWV